jgi:hypothetical protein
VTPTCLAEPACPGLLLETLEGRLSGQISYGGSFCAKKYKTSHGLVRYLGGVDVSCSRAKKVARYWLKHHYRVPSGWKLRYTDGDPNVIVKRRGTSRFVYWNLADGL